MKQLIRWRTCAVAGAFLAAMTLGTAVLQAQIIGEVDAKIPFEFNVENSRLPAGDYVIRPADEPDQAVLELRSADGKVGVFLTTENAQAKQTPKLSELVFDKFGNRYFLREILVEGSAYGYSLPKPKAEVKLEKPGTKAEQHRLTVRHNKTKSKKS